MGTVQNLQLKSHRLPLKDEPVKLKPALPLPAASINQQTAQHVHYWCNHGDWVKLSSYSSQPGLPLVSTSLANGFATPFVSYGVTRV